MMIYGCVYADIDVHIFVDKSVSEYCHIMQKLDLFHFKYIFIRGITGLWQFFDACVKEDG